MYNCISARVIDMTFSTKPKKSFLASKKAAFQTGYNLKPNKPKHKKIIPSIKSESILSQTYHLRDITLR